MPYEARKFLEMRLRALLVSVGAVAIVAVGASAANRLGDSVPLVHVPVGYLAQCRVTARRLGYPLPCPIHLPRALTAHEDGATTGCAITIICAVESGPWKEWAVGSVSSPEQHLVIIASPRPLPDYTKAVDGPSLYPGEHVGRIGWVKDGHWPMRAVFVSPDSNDSIFIHHIVMVWTVGRHTYAVGFHNFTGMRATLRLDQQLAPWIELVGP